mmetsp:Transcript_28348/g.42931  ORF Transcript_28348/g.42931 Transcript_28348/m.42931 type:complete len:139 (-) Transcript_28348:117-533(-)
MQIQEHLGSGSLPTNEELTASKSSSSRIQAENFLNRNISKTEMNSKIVFHCSAGIGRTGTLIAIYNIIESLRILLEQAQPFDQEEVKLLKQTAPLDSVNLANVGKATGPRISVFGVVRRLREQRYCMVQSSSQYEFIY